MPARRAETTALEQAIQELQTIVGELNYEVEQAAVRIGRVVPQHPGLVVLKTGICGIRVVDMLPGDQLPRIC